jgi:virulence factor Mce-like protein
MRSWRTLTAGLLVLGLGSVLGGCSVIGGAGSYPMVVYFAKTPSLYEKSRVKIMGADVGIVRKMKIEGSKVRLDLDIRSKVPVPADVHATIAAESAIGERSVILFPQWKPGEQPAAPGTVVPLTRTEPAVEIDDVLGSFTTLTQSLDPAKVRGLVHAGAQLVDGRGTGINDALTTSTKLANGLAAQDKQLTAVATSLRDLVTSLNDHEAGLRDLIDAFDTTSAQLSGERTQLRDLLVGLSTLIEKGQVIVTAYKETLPKTVSQASSLVMTLKANSASLAQGLQGLAAVTNLLVSADDTKTHTIRARVALTPTLRIWLQPLFTAMSWGKVPCLDQPVSSCQKTVSRGKTP